MSLPTQDQSSLTSRQYLPGSQIELVRPIARRGAICSALFDFDGTISLIREGWQQVMIPMMVELIRTSTPASDAESEEETRAIVVEFVDRLTGKQTIYQMLQLVEEIRKRGGEPLEPLAYKKLYHDRLWERIVDRVADLKAGRADAERLMVPGARELLAGLRDAGITLYLASGTDLDFVLDEVAALGLTSYFDGGIYGALDKWESFSKAMIIEQILRDHELAGARLAIFGDGYVEIENARSVGGIAVGVASDEARREGIDEWKRSRLVSAGADLIVPEFREHERLIAYLLSPDEPPTDGAASVGG